MTTDNNNVINDIPQVFRPFVQNLYQDLKLGLFKSKIDIERIPGNSEGGDGNFRLILPYCSKKLKWEVIFDSASPWSAPDFRFDDDTFLINMDEDLLDEKLPSLRQWDENDPKSLSNVVAEMLNLYKQHQIKKLNEDESTRAFFEYSALLGDALTSERDVEVWVGGHVVEFLIKLNVDVARLPELYHDKQDQNPGLDTALLLVRYPNSTNAELILSPFLYKSLGNITLPLMHQSGVLMDYVPMVTALLNNKIRDIINNEKLKRDLISLLVVKYEGALLEHDAGSTAFLFHVNHFHWILQIDVDTQFPAKSPTVTLRSVYHSAKGKPKTKVLPSCPYSIFEKYILQQVELFKTECKASAANNQINIEN